MQAAFARAVAVASARRSEGTYAFAGLAVRVRVVGGTLGSHIGRSLAHLQDPGPGPTQPRLSIDVWDERDTGIGLPARAAESELGSSWSVEDGTLSSSADGRYVRFKRAESLTWLDRRAGCLVEWRSSAQDFSFYERTKPLRLLLRVWYDDQQVQVIHAGLVSSDGRGALIAGAGRAGKSTTSLACVCAGFCYLGDDYIGIQEVDGSFVGHSIYSSARLERRHVERFPMLARHAIHSDDPRYPKSLFLVAEAFPGRAARSVPIGALLLPRVVDADEPRLRPASMGEALLALAPSSLMLPLGAGERGLGNLARLVERVPRYWLELGHDLSLIPVCVKQALEPSGT